MLAKAPAKKTKSSQKPVRKTAGKAPKKVTRDDIEAGFDRLQKSQDEAWKAIRETQQAVKETQKNIGGLNNTLDSLVERIMTPDLPRKFKPLGFTFDKITIIKLATDGNIYAEIDGLLENGAQAMAVEVKTTLEIEHRNDHLKRMERIRKYTDEHGDKREFLGAIAAMIVKPKSEDYALKKGFFVIEPSGEDVKVTKPETEPRVW
jgi:regulator of replication initiation timing